MCKVTMWAGSREPQYLAPSLRHMQLTKHLNMLPACLGMSSHASQTKNAIRTSARGKRCENQNIAPCATGCEAQTSDIT